MCASEPVLRLQRLILGVEPADLFLKSERIFELTCRCLCLTGVRFQRNMPSTALYEGRTWGSESAVSALLVETVCVNRTGH